MDVYVQQMLADLGGSRRDVISAPNVDARGREIVDDPRREQAIVAENEARRQRYSTEGSNENERARRLRAWNTSNTFETDPSSAALQVRFCGQGHRAALTQSLHGSAPHLRASDDPWDVVEARFGEERRQYLQQRGGDARNHVHAATAGSMAFPQGATTRGRPPTGPSPVSRPGSKRQFIPVREGPSRNGAAPHQRAPSPRAFGTIRFGPGGKRVEAVNGTATVLSGYENQSLARHTPRQLGADSAAIGHQPVLQTAAIKSAPMMPAQPTTNRFQAMARWHVANPGAECDEYYRKNQGELTYYREARAHLIKEVTGLARAGDDDEATKYIETHKERKWMVDAAKAAKSAVEDGTEAVIQNFLAASPRHKLFFEAAEAVFTPHSQPCIRASDGFTRIVASKETDKAQISNRLTAYTGPISASNATQVHTDRRESGIAIACSNDTAQEASSPGSSVDPPAKHRRESSPPHSSECSSSTAASSTQLSTPGILTATFYNIVGEFLGIHQLEADAPVHMSIGVTSHSEGYDPRTLIEDMEAFANKIQDRARGFPVECKSPGSAQAENVGIGEGGLWHENV